MLGLLTVSSPTPQGIVSGIVSGNYFVLWKCDRFIGLPRRPNYFLTTDRILEVKSSPGGCAEGPTHPNPRPWTCPTPLVGVAMGSGRLYRGDWRAQ